MGWRCTDKSVILICDTCPGKPARRVFRGRNRELRAFECPWFLHQDKRAVCPGCRAVSQAEETVRSQALAASLLEEKNPARLGVVVPSGLDLACTIDPADFALSCERCGQPGAGYIDQHLRADLVGLTLCEACEGA